MNFQFYFNPVYEDRVQAGGQLGQNAQTRVPKFGPKLGQGRSGSLLTRVVRKVLRHSLFCQKHRAPVQTTYKVTKYYIYVILG